MKTTHHPHAFRNGTLAVFFASAALTTTAQLDCADLSVDHLLYAAFTDTAMELQVQNASSTQINYPWFSVVDSNADTVARSFGSFFVLPTGSVKNHVPLAPGMSLPASPFTGTVVLHYAAFPGDSTCAFAVTNLELCPPEPCTEVVLYVYQLDTVGDPWLYWTLRNSANTIVANGEMQPAIGDPGSSLDTLCLAPGDYELEIEQSPFATPGSFVATMMRTLYDLEGPHVEFTGNGLLPFTFFPACVDGTNAVQGPDTHALTWSVDRSLLSVTDPTGSPIGNIEIFNAHGALIAQRQVNEASTTIDLSGQATGVLLFSIVTDSGRTVQRFILP